MSTTHFTLTYDGPALQNHEIDARELAPALIAVSDTLEAANGALNGERVRVHVNVRASFRTGCFGIDFSVVQTLPQQVAAFLSSDDVVAADTLISLVTGLGSIGAGLFALLRKLRGRKPHRVIEMKDGHFKIVIDDEEYEVEEEVLELFRDYEVRKGVEGIVRPLEEKGIDQVSVQSGTDQAPVVITKKERSYYSAPPPEQQKLDEREDEGLLQLVSISFKEENKWRFSDGRSTFHAAILDEDFLRRIDLNEERFGKNDVLKVRMRTRQFLDIAGNMRSDVEILEVLEKRSAARQLRLDISEEASGNENVDRDEPPPAQR